MQVASSDQVWDASFEEKTERRLYNIRGHRGFISAAAFSLQAPNLVITGSDDQTVKVWNLLEIKNSKPPNKKKPKQNKHEDHDDEDDHDDDEDSRDEAPAPQNLQPAQLVSQLKDDN